ncbi:MAG: ribosome recycling factor [Elusimicrobia bacterium]|nr:ribosome recycling factor [Candidatus Liberimonas magnetica]
MDWKQILVNGEIPMKKTIEKMRNDFSAIRTGRASAALVEGLKVESYGALMPINQLANIGTSDARTIEIRPWDISQLVNIEKAILKSDLGLTPMNDGKIIRLSIPALTEERRKDLTKVVHKIAEEFRISVRNERRQMLEQVKKAEKDKAITEDDRKKAEVQLQKVTDDYIKKIDEILKTKEKEIMEV